MVTKERFNSFDISKRYLIAASDFARAASLLKDGLKDLADNSIKLGYGFLNYLFDDSPALQKEFISFEECQKLVDQGKYEDIYEIYLKLMELGGIPRTTVLEAEK
ncbi:MAG: hypothetical protein NT030_00555 [Candidatus Saganbacteria bacterium]|nr:hypothetical protein [Candidatus Saganbacteria bacterium]